MNITNVTNVWPPPSPPGLAELQQIFLKELDGGRQWIGWCIAFAVLLGSACFVAHGCWVQCVNTYVVLQARLSGLALLCRPLLTYRFPNIRNLSPPALRILHRRYCKHEDTSTTAATTPATQLPLAVSVPSDKPPKSSDRAIVP